MQRRALAITNINCYIQILYVTCWWAAKPQGGALREFSQASGTELLVSWSSNLAKKIADLSGQSFGSMLLE